MLSLLLLWFLPLHPVMGCVANVTSTIAICGHTVVRVFTRQTRSLGNSSLLGCELPAAKGGVVTERFPTRTLLGEDRRELINLNGRIQGSYIDVVAINGSSSSRCATAARVGSSGDCV